MRWPGRSPQPAPRPLYARPAMPGIAEHATMRRARRRRPRRRRRVLPGQRHRSSSSSGPRRRWSRASSTISPRRHQGLRADARGGAAGGLQGLHQGVCARRHPDRPLRPLYRRSTPRSPICARRADRGQGRRACRRQGRHRRRHRSPRPKRPCEACFSGRFGAAGAEVVIEDCLVGEEASFFALCDGTTACRSPPRRTTSARSTATPARTPAAWAPTRPPRR
jgi:hypothetical protein